jgi:serine/threonine protein kinase
MTVPPTDQASLGQEVFGPYMVYERLGVGGMATVHRALEHGIEGFERIVALKRLLPHLAEDASFVKSFVREAKLASMLRHAHIVQLYELGRVGTTYFISMEYIDGRDIRRILRQARKVTGPPHINVTLAMLIQLADALDYAHTRCDDQTGEPLRLVHRDVSPSNLLITKSGHLKVIDFGIAKAQSQQLRTATGRVKGKLAYMAPEAIAGKELDARSDVFSAGVIAHELLTARPLFASKNEYQTLLKVQKGDILPPSTFNQACPPELDAIVLKALARDPDHRWSSAAEMRDALHEIRIRYHLSSTNREISSWCDWAFAMEAPGNNFSGPVVTDSLAGASQSRSPIAMPLPASSISAVTPIGVPSGVPIQHMGGAASGPAHRDEEEAADVAWGGGQEHDSGAPIVLDEVPDHSGRARAPSMAGALAAAAETPLPAPRSTLVGVAAPSTFATHRKASAPAAFPHGSSDDALSGRTKRSSSPPAATARDTEPTPLVEASSFGAGMIGAQKSNGARNLVIGVLAAAAIAAGLFFTMGGGSGASTKAAKKDDAVVEPAEKQVGKLKFIVDPSDAIVKIAGMEPHQGSDWTVELEAGELQVEIAREGFKSWVTKVELSANETQTIRVVLERGGNASMATLVIDSIPQHMTVLVDGHEVGKTPFTTEVPPGGHSVAVRESGEVKWKEWVQAEANTKYEFRPDMSEVKQRERAARVAAAARAEEEDRAPAPRTTAPAPGAGSASEAPRPVTGGVSGGGSTGVDVGTAQAPAPAPAPTKTDPAPAPAPTPKVDAPPPKPAPAPAPKKVAGPVTVAPNAVKKVSGEIPSIKTVVRRGEEVPKMVSAKICIDVNGKVNKVDVMKLTGDLADKIEDALRGWRYTPYKQDGLAVPACFATTFKLSN